MKKIILTGLMALFMFMLSGNLVSARTSASTFYYNQLTPVQKTYYDKIDRSNLKNGDMSPIFIAKSKEKIYKDINSAVDAYSEDHTEVFWAITTYYTGEKNSEGEWEYYLKPIYYDCFNEANIGAIREQTSRVVREIVEEASKKDSIYDKLLYVHNWLTRNNYYNTEVQSYNDDMIPWSPISALLEGYSPVCEGYSKAFKIICDELDIPCVLVSNTEHMWNYVAIKDKWYGVDVTYDDPIVKRPVKLRSGKENQKNFLVGANTRIGSETFLSTHKPYHFAIYDWITLPSLEPDKYPNKELKSLKLNKSSAKLDPGKTLQLKATLVPFKVNDPTIYWSSDSPDIATVSNDGLVTAISPGKANVTVTGANGKSKTCKVTVKGPTPVSGVKLNKTRVKKKITDKNLKVTLKATVKPTKAANKDVSWTCSDPNILEIQSFDNKSCNVLIKGSGQANITVETVDGSFTKTCVFTVKEDNKTKK